MRPHAVIFILLLALLARPGGSYPVRAAAGGCQHVFGAAASKSACVSRSEANQLALTALFSEVDPTTTVRRDTGLALAGIMVQRSAARYIPPPGAARLLTHAGPPMSFFYRYGRTPAPNRLLQPPGPRATFADVREWLEAERRGIHLLRESATGSMRNRSGIWRFSADLDHGHVSLEVESDGPKAMVSRLGWDLVEALRATRVPPSLPVQVYVLPPRGVLHVGHPATFYVADNAGLITAPVGIDYAFRLGGSWGRPHTFAPGNTEACGGDIVPGQPYLKHGQWKFAWGDCDELGLVLTPTRPGPHSLTIYCYRVALNQKGVPDPTREQLEPRETYVWHADIRV